MRSDELNHALTDPVLGSIDLLNDVVLRHPEAISFAPGWPAERFFDVADLHHHLDVYVDYRRRHGHSAEEIRRTLFQYGGARGHIGDVVARMLAVDEGIHVDPQAVVVTVGCQEGIYATLRTLSSGPDDVVLVQSPTYFGVTAAALLQDIEVAPVPETPEGIDPDQVAATARTLRAQGKRPRALYVIPDFANPSGTRFTQAVRRDLLDVASAENLMIIEDNPYGIFGDRREPTLKSLDADRRVVYIGSFSKSLLPGVRCGYTVADQPVHGDSGDETTLAAEIAKVKSIITVNTSPIDQAIVAGMLIEHDFRLRDSDPRRIDFYLANMRTLLDELDRNFAGTPSVRWNTPRGGFFVTLDLPFPVDLNLLHRSAREYGVVWTPMSYFYPAGGGERSVRLSCSYLDRKEIVEGVRRLREFVAGRCARS